MVVRHARLVDGRVVSLGIVDGLYVSVTEDDVEVSSGLAIDAKAAW